MNVRPNDNIYPLRSANVEPLVNLQKILFESTVAYLWYMRQRALHMYGLKFIFFNFFFCF